MDIKITGVTFEIMRDALTQAKAARTFILGEMAKVIDAPRAELSKYAPGISSVQIDPEKIGLLIGKGGETIRALQEEFEAQIDVNDEGMVLVYAADRERGDALVDRIRSMTKEVEVGDEFSGKVVKTTAFGAFVELAKGTDGLLHISNIAPGRRIASVEEVLNKGDEVDVRVVEVDRERGRIGLRLADDPDIVGKSVEELAAVGTGDNGPPRRDRGDRGGRDGRDRDRRGPRDRDRDRAAIATADGTASARVTAPAAACATAIPSAAEQPHVLQQHKLTTLDSGVRVVTEAMPSVRSVSIGFWIATGSRTEDDQQAGLSHLLEHLLFKGTEKYGSLEIDQIFDAMGAELNAGTGKETTSVYARVIDDHVAEAFDVMADMVFRPTLKDIDSERAVILEEIAMYEDDPQEKVFDLLGEAVFGDHPLGRAIIGRASVIADTPPEEIARFHADRYGPENVVIAAAGAVDHDAFVELAAKSIAERDRPPRADGLAGGRRRGGAPPLRAQGHRAVPRVPRRDRPVAPRRAPVRAAGARQRVRRHLLLAAVPGGPRAARPRLRGVLVHERLPGHGPGGAVHRHPARQHRRGPGGGRSRARPPPRGARDPGGARARQGEPQGPGRARARVDRRPHEPPRLGDPRRTCRCCRWTRPSSGSTR